MKRIAVFLLSVVFLLTMGGAAAAQQQETSTSKSTSDTSPSTASTTGAATSSTTTQTHFGKGTDLMGSTIKNSQGQSLGKVENIVVDMDSGNVSYVVLSSGGYIGIGSKELIAVPWKSFKLGQDSQSLVLDMDKQKLEQAPRFSQDKWPSMGDAKWSEQVANYFGTATTQTGQASKSGQEPTPMGSQQQSSGSQQQTPMGSQQQSSGK